MDPDVTVIIPAYRATAFIAEALDSALAQTVRPLEIIVVNDGCPDTANLEVVLAPYLASSPVRYVIRENGGVSAARNTGVRAARTPLLVMLDSDDRLRPDSLEIHLGIFRKRPEAAMIYGNGVFFGGTTLDGQKLMKYFPSPTGNVSYEDLITRRANTTAGVMFRRESILEAGLYDESIRKAEDFELALRLARRGGVIETTEAVVYDYRVRPDSLSHSDDDVRRWRIRVLEMQQQAPDVSGPVRELVAAELRYQYAAHALEEGKRALLAGDYALSRARLREANRELRSPRLSLISFLLMVIPRPLRAFSLFREKSSERRNASGRTDGPR